MARVTAPLVIAKRADGSDVYLYEDAPVPDGLLDGELERLTDAGLIGEDEDSTESKSSSRPKK